MRTELVHLSVALYFAPISKRDATALKKHAKPPYCDHVEDVTLGASAGREFISKNPLPSLNKPFL